MPECDPVNMNLNPNPVVTAATKPPVIERRSLMWRITYDRLVTEDHRELACLQTHLIICTIWVPRLSKGELEPFVGQ